MEWMFMPLKRYAEFSGRSRRQEFWMFVLGLFLLYLVFMVIVMMVGFGAMGVAASGGTNAAMTGMAGMLASMGILAVVLGIIWLALLIPTLAVQVRRLHDTDRSGWWVMLYWGPVLLAWVLAIGSLGNGGTNSLAAISGIFSLVSWIGIIVLIVFYCLPGTSGPNKYGPDPLGGTGNLSDTFA